MKKANHVTYYSTVRNSDNLRFTLYDIIKLIMLRIHVERSSNE